MVEPRGGKHAVKTPKHRLRPTEGLAEPHGQESSGSDSELENSIESVSSDGGEYMDLPIVVDHNFDSMKD